METIRQRPVNGDGGLGLDFATVEFPSRPALAAAVVARQSRAGHPGPGWRTAGVLLPHEQVLEDVPALFPRLLPCAGPRLALFFLDAAALDHVEQVGPANPHGPLA